MRTVFSVIAGYIIFVISSLLLFYISGQKPHEDATNLFILFTAIYGSLFSIVAGFTTHSIVRSKTLNVNYILTLTIAVIAGFSIFKSNGNHWTQILAITIFAPCSILGGMLHKYTIHKNQ